MGSGVQIFRLASGGILDGSPIEVERGSRASALKVRMTDAFTHDEISTSPSCN